MESKSINIKIKTLDNALYEFAVSKDISVNDLKTKINEQMKIPIHRQRLIFQGKMLKNTDLISTYKIEDGHVVHLVANLIQADQSNEANQSDLAVNRNDQANDMHSDLDLLAGMLRAISETSLNRRNLRRRILQQRTGGFNMDVTQSLEVAKQNINNLDYLIQNTTKLSEITVQDTHPASPFDFNGRKLYIGQWVDAKDTIDQWLEAQVLNIKDNQAFIHYNGWGNLWDEWIDMSSNRIALFRTYTVQSSNSRYMSPFPNNPADGDQSNIPQQQNDFFELLDDTSRVISDVSGLTDELLHKINPAHSVAKSEKSEKHITTKQDMELQHVISGMIEEQKYQNPSEKETKSEKNVYFEDCQSVKSHKSVEKNIIYEDTQSVKSHKSLDYDTISVKSIKSYISASDMKNVNPQLNFPDYISEEDSEERSEISSTNVNIPTQSNLRDLQVSLIASQLAPLFDRLGRLLIDLAPHLAMLGSVPQTIIHNQISNSQAPHVNPNMTLASIMTNESGQTIMLTPGEVHQANNASVNSNRLFGDTNNADLHIHTILGRYRNLPTNPHNTSVSNTGVNTNIGSPVTRHNPEFRFRQENIETKEIIRSNYSNLKDSEQANDFENGTKIKLNEEGEQPTYKLKTVTFEGIKDENFQTVKMTEGENTSNQAHQNSDHIESSKKDQELKDDKSVQSSNKFSSESPILKPDDFEKDHEYKSSSNSADNKAMSSKF